MAIVLAEIKEIVVSSGTASLDRNGLREDLANECR
jgi:hypothetical protein